MGDLSLHNLLHNSHVKICNGELVSFQKFGREFMHQKGAKGWRNTDTEMFPVIGPLKRNDYKVLTPNGDAIQDQHGLLRELDYELLEHTETTAVYEKVYTKNQHITNSKYPDKSTVKEVFWPYDFRFVKRFELSGGVLKIAFEIESSKGMPFMLGYHPAFKISKDSIVQSDSRKEVTLDHIMETGADAFPVLKSSKISLVHSDTYAVDISTEGFNNFMLWTEVDSMLCIEPITQFPDLVEQQYSQDNMSISNGKEIFTVFVNPLRRQA